MPTRIQELSTEFTARLSNFKAGINQGINLVGAFARAANTSFGRVRDSADRMATGVVDSFKAIERTASRTALVVGGSMTVMAGATVKLGDDFIKTKDTALMAFEAMLGSGEQAMAFYERLEQFERETPFEMPGLLKAAQRLLATKMAAEKVIPALRSIGDAVALTGGGAEQIDRAVVALSQMSAKQKISFEEMNQLAEAGVFAWEALATTLGVDVPTAMDMATKKGNEVYQHFDRFLLEIGKSAEGAMSKQSKMLTGVLSTMSSAASKAAGEIVEPLYREATKFLAWASGPSGFQLKGVSDALKKTAETIATDVFDYLQLNGQEILDRLGEAFVTFGQGLQGLVGYIRENGNALAMVVKSMADWGLAIAKWLADHPRFTAALAATKVALMTGIPQAIGKTIYALVSLGLHLTTTALLFRMVFGSSLIGMILNAVRQLYALVAASEMLKRSWIAINTLKLFGGWAGVIGEVLSKIKLLSTAMVVLKGAVIGVVAYTAYQIGVWARQFFYAEDWTAKLNENLKEGIKLTERLFVIRQRALGLRIQDAMANPDREQGLKDLETQKAIADKNLESYRAKIKELQKLQFDLEINRTAMNVAEIRLAEAKIATLQSEVKNLEEAQKEVEALAEAIADLQRQIITEKETKDKEPKGPDGKPVAPGAPAGGGDVPPPIGAEPPKKTPEERRDERIRQHGYKQEEQADPFLKGLAEAMRILEGATLDQIEDYFAGLDGMTEEALQASITFIKNQRAIWDQEEAKMKAEAKADLESGKLTKEQYDKELERIKAERVKAERGLLETEVHGALGKANRNVETRDRTKDTENDAFNSLHRFEKDLDPKQMKAFQDQIEAIRKKFIELGMSQEEYNRALDAVQDKIADTAKANKAIEDADADMEKHRKQGVDPRLQEDYGRIRWKVKAGEMSPEDFQREWGKIEEKIRATQEAEQAFQRARFEGMDPSYAEEWQKLTEALHTGALNADAYREAIADLTGRMKAEREAEQKMGVLEKDGPVSKEAMDIYNGLLRDLQSKRISVDEFNQAMSELTTKIQEGQQAFGVFKDLMQGVFGQTFGMASQAAQQLQAQFAFLQQQLDTDKISVAQFRQQVQLLAQASERAAAAERRRRLINGDFQGAGLNLWEAVLDKIANMRMEQFDLMATNWANQLTGLGGMFQQVGDDLNYWRQQVGDFVGSLPGGGDINQAFGKVLDFMASLEGQRQIILNNIQLLRQSLQVTEDALSRKDLQGKIDELIQQLQVLDQQQANLPTFVADRGELDFKDPGLSGGGGSNRSSKGGSVTITLPNVTRISQTDAEVMANIVAREMQRRGRNM